jgi:hypothetical protein
MHESAARPELGQMIVEVVRIEGPAHQELVLRRVREAWGVQRAGTRIRAAFDSVVKSLSRRGSVSKDRAGFLSTDGLPVEVVRSATDDPRSLRGVDEIPSAELGLAVEMLVKDARSISWDELTIRVARLFGWSRRGPDIANALDIAISVHLQGGTVVQDDDGMLIPGDVGA